MRVDRYEAVHGLRQSVDGCSNKAWECDDALHRDAALRDQPELTVGELSHICSGPNGDPSLGQELAHGLARWRPEQLQRLVLGGNYRELDVPSPTRLQVRGCQKGQLVGG